MNEITPFSMPYSDNKEDLLKLVDIFHTNGFAIIEDAFSDHEVAEMQEEISQIIEQVDTNNTPKLIFTTSEETKHVRDKYFLDSVDKISHFYEEGAIDNISGKLLVPKNVAFNKIGHALHWENTVFRRYTFHKRIKSILRSLNFKHPKVVQSMYIFKQPREHVKNFHDNAVNAHVDSTFLHIKPATALLGVWIAIDTATVENGCLWFAPGSHLNDAYLKAESLYRFVRTESISGSQQLSEVTGEQPLLKFIGAKPTYEDLTYIPVEVKRGSIVVIDGQVVHKSETNFSRNSRHAYTFHVIESSSEWETDNWLQETNTYKFPSIY